MSVEYVSTMSLEYCVSYVPERFTSPDDVAYHLGESSYFILKTISQLHFLELKVIVRLKIEPKPR